MLSKKYIVFLTPQRVAAAAANGKPKKRRHRKGPPSPVRPGSATKAPRAADPVSASPSDFCPSPGDDRRASPWFLVREKASHCSSAKIFSSRQGLSLENHLADLVQGSFAPLLEAVGEPRGLQMMASIAAWLPSVPPSWRRKLPSISQQQDRMCKICLAALLRMAWGFCQTPVDKETRKLSELLSPKGFNESEIQASQCMVINWMGSASSS